MHNISCRSCRQEFSGNPEGESCPLCGGSVRGTSLETVATQCQGPSGRRQGRRRRLASLGLGLLLLLICISLGVLAFAKTRRTAQAVATLNYWKGMSDIFKEQGSPMRARARKISLLSKEDVDSELTDLAESAIRLCMYLQDDLERIDKVKAEGESLLKKDLALLRTLIERRQAGAPQAEIQELQKEMAALNSRISAGVQLRESFKANMSTAAAGLESTAEAVRGKMTTKHHTEFADVLQVDRSSWESPR